MADYTTPFFGTVDMGSYEPPPLADIATRLPNRNRADSIKTNSKGQVYEGDIYLNHTCSDVFSTASAPILSEYESRNQVLQCKLIGASDKPMCILAIPRNYGNFPGTGEGHSGYMWSPVIKKFCKMDSFNYYIVSHNKGASFTFECQNRTNSGAYISGVRGLQAGKTQQYEYTGELPELSLLNPNISNQNPLITQSRGVVGAKITDANYGLLRRLNRLNDKCTNSGVSGIDTIQVETRTRLGILMASWLARPDQIADEVYYYDLSSLAFGNVASMASSQNNAGYDFCFIGSFIASVFPIFTLDSFDQMVRYFQGESYLADNDPPPPSDWSTDWDIYVKGAQKPEIFITMTSPKVDEWLADLEENPSGLSKDDIKVEYRYREYALNTVLDSPNPYGNSYNTVEWLTDTYNTTRETSYSENLQLNYTNINAITGGLLAGKGGEFSDTSVTELYSYYAELGFRIHYGKYMSAWCRYEIGVIGSPSVPDFTKMNNFGGQDDAWQDDSTVTLHYDEYPPDYDPYPTPQPNPPMPPAPDDTNPSEIPQGQNGIGLLTTTYKITIAQAEALGRFFWGGDIFQKIKALNTSPIENVVGLMVMPINITGVTDVIVIGDVDTNINGDKISTVPIYSLGSVKITGRYKSFLDYEPYTTMHIFLPFVGFVRLDPVYVTGKTLSVKYAFDVINGLCNAMLFVDGVYIESHQGRCGVDIPLVGGNRAELAVGLATSLITTAASAAVPMATATTGAQSLGAGVGAGTSMAQSISDYITGFHSERQGGYSPTLAWNETRNCFLVIETPNASYTSTYAHDRGLPCNASHSLGSLSGFTVCDSTIDLSGISGATEEEKSMIMTILTTGVLL